MYAWTNKSVEVKDPLKQGLKPTYKIWHLQRLGLVEVKDPLKQGLKPNVGCAEPTIFFS